MKQYISYCSVGINERYHLVPFPVLSVINPAQGENYKPKLRTQTSEEAATERGLTLLLISDIFEFDKWGFSKEIVGRWFQDESGGVYATDMAEATEAIFEIRSKYETLKAIKEIQNANTNPAVRRDSDEEGNDRRIG